MSPNLRRASAHPLAQTLLITLIMTSAQCAHQLFVDQGSAQAQKPTVAPVKSPTERSAKPDSAKPDSAKPDSAKPDSAKPDSAKPDSAQPSGSETAMTPKSSALEAAERYYQATSLDALEEALKQLRTQWPEHYLRWEVETLHAQLNLQRSEVSAAALKALERLVDPSQAQAIELAREARPLIPRSVYHWPLSERDHNQQRIQRLMRALPNVELRATLAWSARHIAHYSGDATGYNASSEEIGPLLPLSVIGTWDNDQGKGLDVVYPPEREFNLTARYPGKLTEIGWRAHYPQDLRGKVNLHELLSPDQWQVAYGASAVAVGRDTDAELRISSTDPIKVWVNGELALRVSRLNGWAFDGIKIPIKLRTGVNYILIKSAQQTGGWMLTARLTEVGGAPLSYEAVSIDTPHISRSPSEAQITAPKPLDEEDIARSFETRFSAEAPARRAFHTLHLLEEVGLSVKRLSYSEEVAQRFPESVWLKISRATALWDNNERGRAADLIAALYELSDRGARAAYLVDLQVRFWRQQRLTIKARSAARALCERQPKLAAGHQLLASLLKREEWHEERCAALHRAESLTSPDQDLESELAHCERKTGLRTRSRLRAQALWSRFPHQTSHLGARFNAARRRDDYATMVAVARECIKTWPQRGRCYEMHASALWSAGHHEEAFKALEAWRQLNPLYAEPLKDLGAWRLTLGDRAQAIEAWREALKLDPEDQDLALRLSELEPKRAEPWLADVPSDATVRAAVELRSTIKPDSDANQVYLLDDEVTLLKADGSTESVVTQVVHALNQKGRDDLTKMYVGRQQTQLMAAYAVNPDGVRVEASSIRRGVVRFRKLQVGSTVVLQHRSGNSAGSYLVGHISKSWWFQNKDMQVIESRWVLWTPEATQLRELARKANALREVAPLERTEERHGSLKRFMWRMRDLPPIPSEPKMPPLFSQVASLSISTVPSWDEVFKWERELLRDAFRMSPEVKTLAQELIKPEMDTQTQFYKIHEYVMRNIRYQQDYEHTIAGVKPHTAAQVLARQYGDCKDKAVLFITLAQAVGLKADFALVRTRNSGPVDREIPSQQFNHAIVYVPAQPGLKEGRFFDPTVDALDVKSLRSDDQGTTSLVYNPRADEHYWRDIPFQSPEYDSSEDLVELEVDAQGGVSGSLTLKSQGRVGQFIRQRARNPEAFKQLMQSRVSQLFPGAEMGAHKSVSIDDLYQPAVASIDFKHSSWLKREGDVFRVPVIVDWSPKSLFGLDRRRFPLVLGHKRQWSWRVRLTLAPKIEVGYVPEDRVVSGACLSVRRASQWDETSRVLTITWSYQNLCDQLSPEEYLSYRSLSREMLQLLNEEVVIRPAIKREEQEALER